MTHFLVLYSSELFLVVVSALILINSIDIFMEVTCMQWIKQWIFIAFFLLILGKEEEV